MSDYGRERIVLVEIDQPLCTRVYGDGLASPTPASGCLAILSATDTRKCFNTRFTCQDPDNYSPGTLTLRFARKQHELGRYYGIVIPSYISHTTTPGAINLAAMYDSAESLGQREVVTISFEDHQHSDLLVDKYRLQRQTGEAMFGSPSETYDPFTRGTFWGKWLARNPYYSGYALRIYEGFLGDSIDDMTVRHYIIDRVEGPSEGEVRIIAKDTFSKLEEKKAVAPLASRGELGSNITAVGTSASLSPTGIGDEDYPHMTGSPSEFYVAISGEIIKCSRLSDTLSLLQRGAFNTDPDEHNDEDLVQWCLVYFSQRAHDIIYDLLVNYGGIPSSSIDQDEWDTQAEEMTQLYSACIAEPTPVAKLVGELCQQAGCSVWHDPSTGMVNLRALRATTSIETIDDNAWLIDGSLRTKRQDDKRVSQVWVYYGQKNPLESLTDRRNYFSRVVSVDPDAESEEQYGTPKMKEVFSRWIPQFGRDSATQTGERILSVFRDPPYEARFSLDASKDGDLSLARFVTIVTAEVQDDTGAEDESKQYAVVSLERSDSQVHVVAQGVQFAPVPGGTGSESDPRTIFIENNTNNINLRAIHDSLYAAPEGGSPSLVVTFVVMSGVTVGSTSTSNPSIRTGSWPIGVHLTVRVDGRIEGRGGDGGDGGLGPFPGFPGAGENGGDGGTAILVESAVSIDNTSGQIWGGGGGGGGGAASSSAGQDGSGGGGGAGTQSGNGGAAGPSGEAGSAGSATTGGDGGDDFGFGNGGDGGGPGLNGSAGISEDLGSGGSGGTAGKYVDGNSLVTWIAVGDVRGNVS